MNGQCYYDGTYDDMWDLPHVYCSQLYHKVCTDLLVDENIINSWGAQNHRKILLDRHLEIISLGVLLLLSFATAFTIDSPSSAISILCSLGENVKLFLIWVRKHWFIRPPPLLPVFRRRWSNTLMRTQLALILASAGLFSYIRPGGSRWTGESMSRHGSSPHLNQNHLFHPSFPPHPRCRGLVHSHASLRINRFCL